MQSFLKNFIEYVIDWNDTITHTNDIDEQRLELQIKITLSEIQETIDAYFAKDAKEVIDGVGDIIVTAGYMPFLNEVSKDYLSKKLYDYELDDLNILDLAVRIKFHVLSNQVDLQILYDLLIKAVELYGEDYVKEYLTRILLSNDSKFIPSELCDEELELKHAKEKYKDQFNDIVLVDGVFRGKAIKMIRADNGVGKLLKPTMFVEPEDTNYTTNIF